MKRIGLFIALVTLACTLHAQNFQFVSMNPDTALPGYSGNMTITINNGFQVATGGINLKLRHTSGQEYNFGNAPTGAGWNTNFHNMNATGPVVLPNTMLPGLYDIILNGWDQWGGQTIINRTYNDKLLIQGDVGYFKGRFVLDPDLNCSFTTGDMGLGNQLITATPGPYYGMTDPTGNFTLAMPLGSYTITGGNTTGLIYVCPGFPHTLPASVSVIGDTVSGLDFYLRSNNLNDISVTTTAFAHRPGFGTSLAQVAVNNNGFTTVTNVVVKLVKPSNFIYTNLSPAPTSVNGDTAIWNIPSMGPASSLVLSSTVMVPIGSVLGSSFTYRAYVSCAEPETNYANNESDDANGFVTGSFDPNDKQVWNSNGENADGPILASDSLLTYLIRFQNTGTDTAFNIYILDTLDTNLNVASLQIIGASDPYQIIMDSTGYGVKFLFSNILLPDSNTNEAESHGFIRYSIRQPGNLPTGTVISNGAGIYFDFNSPVLTNVVNSTICPLLDSAFTFNTSLLTVNFQGPTIGGANSWTWDFGDGQSGTGTNPAHTYATGGIYTVCLTVTNACGRSVQECVVVSLSCTALNAGFSFSQGSGYTMNFVGTSTGSAPSSQWTFGDGGTSTAMNPAHTYSLPGTYTVCLIITDACSDMDTLCQTVVVTCPPMNSAFNHGPLSSNNVNFTNASTGMYSGVQWLFGDGGSSTLPNPSHTYAGPGLYTVCLILTNDCGAQDTSCTPLAVGCANLSSAFTSNMSYNVATFNDLSQGTNVTYLWDFGDGGTSTAASPVHIYHTAGTFTVCLTVTDDCQQTDLICHTVVVACVAPTADFTSAINGTTVTFTDQSIDGPTSWVWDFGDGNSSILQHPVHTYAAHGTYNVCLTTYNSCGPSAFCVSVITSTTGIGLLQDMQIALVPNPATDHVMVRITQGSLQDVSFRLCDALGRVVHTWNEAEVRGDYVHGLDVTPQAAGMYYLHIQAEGQQRVMRLVIN